jgi:hypothetical protein
MSIFDKFKFWKHDDIDFDAMTSQEMGQTPGIEEQSPFPNETNPTMPEAAPPPPYQTRAAGTPERDLELVNSKLDTLKAILVSMDQRLANLEKPRTPPKERLW